MLDALQFVFAVSFNQRQMQTCICFNFYFHGIVGLFITSLVSYMSWRHCAFYLTNLSLHILLVDLSKL